MQLLPHPNNSHWHHQWDQVGVVAADRSKHAGCFSPSHACHISIMDQTRLCSVLASQHSTASKHAHAHCTFASWRCCVADTPARGCVHPSASTPTLQVGHLSACAAIASHQCGLPTSLTTCMDAPVGCTTQLWCLRGAGASHLWQSSAAVPNACQAGQGRLIAYQLTVSSCQRG